MKIKLIITGFILLLVIGFYVNKIRVVLSAALRKSALKKFTPPALKCLCPPGGRIEGTAVK